MLQRDVTYFKAKQMHWAFGIDGISDQLPSLREELLPSFFTFCS
jgi:hypothetical protein